MMNTMLVSLGASLNLYGKISFTLVTFKIKYLIRKLVKHPMSYGRIMHLTKCM